MRIHRSNVCVRSCVRRRSASHDRPIFDRTSRLRNVAPEIGGTEGALPRRREIRAIRNLRVAQRSLGHMKRAATDRLSAGEGSAGGHGNSARVVGVGVIKIAHIALGDEAAPEEGVANVDSLDKRRSAPEPGMKRFTPAEWEPPDADANAEAKTTAEETNERRTIHARIANRAGAPTPA